MADVEIRLKGLDQLEAKLAALQGFARSPELLGLMHEAGEAGVGLLMRDVPKRSYQLKKSIGYKIVDWGSPSPAIRFGAGGGKIDYAGYLEFGTAPHQIRPRVKSALSWFRTTGGATKDVPVGLKGMPPGSQVFAQSVNHPGIAPRPFFFKNIQRVSARFQKLVGELLAKKLEQSGGAGPI